MNNNKKEIQITSFQLTDYEFQIRISALQKVSKHWNILQRWNFTKQWTVKV